MADVFDEADYESALHVLKQDGCGHCEQMKPIVKEFAKRHPDVLVLERDLLTGKVDQVGHDGRRRHLGVEPWDDTELGWAPQATPTFVVTAPDAKTKFGAEGAMDLSTLEAFHARARLKQKQGW